MLNLQFFNLLLSFHNLSCEIFSNHLTCYFSIFKFIFKLFYDSLVAHFIKFLIEDISVFIFIFFSIK